MTTEAIVLEVGDGLALPSRRRFSSAFRALLANPSVEIVPLSLYLEESWQLFDARADKEWSLTDCFSFVVMREHELTDAFAHDHHFEQAGFRALLRP
jgi:predicted nucleic acid-binding protein